MKKFNRSLFCMLLCTLPLLVAAENGSGRVCAKLPLSQTEPSIPVELLGQTIEIRSGITRFEAKAMLSTVMQEVPSVDIKEMLQYDVQLVPDNAPVAIVFYFDSHGGLERFVLDAYLKEQNPSAVKLIAWLNKQHIRSFKKRHGQTIWSFGRWEIEHTDGGSGDDSVYRIELTRETTGQC